MKRKAIQQKRHAIDRPARLAHELIDLFFESTPLIAGTLSLVKRTCGNPNCRCATRGQGHAAWTLLTKHEGKRRCQVVRKADVEAVAEKIRRYRQLKEALRTLKELDKNKYRLLKEVIEARNETYE